MAITLMAVVGGLIFSLAIALLAEELIFGQIFRLFFSQRKLVPVKIGPTKLTIQAAALKSQQKN